MGDGPSPNPDRTPEMRRRREATTAGFEAARVATTADAKQAALDSVVTCNMAMAKTLAGRHRHKGIPIEDLEQVAYAALTRAVSQFRVEEGADFLAYAVPTIRGELKRYFRDQGWMVRPPRRIQELQSQAFAVVGELTQRLGHSPTVAQLAEELGEPVDDVRDALAAEGCFQPASLDRPVGSGGESETPHGELIVQPDGGALAAAEARVMLGPAVRRLCQRDRDVVRMRFYEGLTQAEIGDALGVTQTQVSRILRRIIVELHQTIEIKSTEPAESLTA